MSTIQAEEVHRGHNWGWIAEEDRRGIAAVHILRSCLVLGHAALGLVEGRRVAGAGRIDLVGRTALVVRTGRTKIGRSLLVGLAGRVGCAGYVGLGGCMGLRTLLTVLVNLDLCGDCVV